MSKNNAKSLTTLRQKYRKYAKDYESDIAVFRENPDAPDSDAEVEHDDQDDDSDDGSLMDRGPAAFGKEVTPLKWVVVESILLNYSALFKLFLSCLLYFMHDGLGDGFVAIRWPLWMNQDTCWSLMRGKKL